MKDYITLDQLNDAVRRLPEADTYPEKYIRIGIRELVHLPMSTNGWVSPSEYAPKLMFIYFEKKRFAEDVLRKDVWVFKSPQKIYIR